MSAVVSRATPALAAPARSKAADFFFRKGEPMIWIAGSGLAISLLLIFGLLALVALRGLGFFWPRPLVLLETRDGKRVLGEILSREAIPEAKDGAHRIRVKIANRDLNGLDFRWIDEKEITARETPLNALLLERQEYGNFHGFLKELRRGDEVVGGADAAGLARLRAEQERVRPAFESLRETESKEVGAINAALGRDRLSVRRAELKKSPDLERLKLASAARQSELRRRYESLRERLETQRRELAKVVATFVDAEGKSKTVAVRDIVRIVTPNSLVGREGGRVFSRGFLLDDPRGDTKAGSSPRSSAPSSGSSSRRPSQSRRRRRGLYLRSTQGRS